MINDMTRTRIKHGIYLFIAITDRMLSESRGDLTTVGVVDKSTCMMPLEREKERKWRRFEGKDYV